MLLVITVLLFSMSADIGDWSVEETLTPRETNEKQNVSLSLLLIWSNYSLMLVRGGSIVKAD